MRANGITMAAVGYAGANLGELQAIANDPDEDYTTWLKAFILRVLTVISVHACVTLFFMSTLELQVPTCCRWPRNSLPPFAQLKWGQSPVDSELWNWSWTRMKCDQLKRESRTCFNFSIFVPTYLYQHIWTSIFVPCVCVCFLFPSNFSWKSM